MEYSFIDYMEHTDGGKRNADTEDWPYLTIE
jgi:hypothetical protein